METTTNKAVKVKKQPLTPEAVAEADRKRREHEEKRAALKAENFIRLGNLRIPRTLNMLRVVRNLANKNNYAYTAEQAEKIVKALRNEVDEIEKSFSSAGRKSNEFTL